MKTVFVTGASSGIGRATAAHFLSQGWNVVATMRRPDDASDIFDHERALVVALDGTDDALIADAVAAALDQFGQIDVLVNNAGYGAYGPLEAFTMDRVQRVFDTNVIGLLAVMKAVIPNMRERRSGTIVNVSSVGGQVAFPTGTLYHGTKFAVEGLSEALHYELEPLGIRVRIVEPGMVKTDFGGRSFDGSSGEAPAEYEPTIAGTARMFGSLGSNAAEPETVAGVIWDAANDSTDQLRYRAGNDGALALLDDRKTQDDATFMKGMKERMAGRAPQ
jgi:NADP-dependent 3-hydroxy acid dehydrogenase YdfG